MAKREARKYTEEFRREAVKLAQKESIRGAANGLGLPIAAWLKSTEHSIFKK